MRDDTITVEREPPDLLASSNLTLHKAAGRWEEVYRADGRVHRKMECGAGLPGTGHPYNELMVEDFKNHDDKSLCSRCFPDGGAPDE